MSCRSILIIEDEPSIRSTLQELLKLEGYQTVYGAANGQEALELLRRIEHPCLILLDLMMPVMDGFQFLDRRDESDIVASIPIVIMSAAWESAKKAQRRVEGIMKKPVDFDRLLETVHKYCASQRKEVA